MSDLYETLGVDKDADKAAIRKAYRRRARETHPDSGGSAEAFHAIELAHRVLSDDERRKRYDRTGRADDSAVINGDAAPLSMLAAMIDSLISEPGAIHDDIIGEMRKGLTAAGKDTDKQLAEARQAVARLLKLVGRLKRTGKANGAVEAMFARNVENAQARVDAGIEHRRNIDRAIELLEGYSFEPEERPVSKTSFGAYAEEDFFRTMRGQRHNFFTNTR